MASLPCIAPTAVQNHFALQVESFLERIETMLELEYTLEIDFEPLWECAARNWVSEAEFGALLTRHVEAFLEVLERFITRYDARGRSCFNLAVNRRAIRFQVNPNGISSDTVSSSIQDGTYVVRFHPSWFGSAFSEPVSGHYTVDSNILQLVDATPLTLALFGGLSLRAQRSIDEYYVPDPSPALRELLGDYARLDPRWLELYTELKAYGPSRTQTLGRDVMQYFDSLGAQVAAIPELATPEMRRRAQERIHTKTVTIRFVPGPPAGLLVRKPVVIEDGILYLQFTTDEFGETRRPDLAVPLQIIELIFDAVVENDDERTWRDSVRGLLWTTREFYVCGMRALLQRSVVQATKSLSSLPNTMRAATLSTTLAWSSLSYHSAILGAARVFREDGTETRAVINRLLAGMPAVSELWSEHRRLFRDHHLSSSLMNLRLEFLSAHITPKFAQIQFLQPPGAWCARLHTILLLTVECIRKK
uniref:Uncharacterized protein n=1 Tax=Mycena chlorophos TaxID=658473 RepID=A0ABQ0L113_MYCCL|nr:predicted protein [Mycena chlorophos]